MAVIVRVLCHHEPEGWWAESPDIAGWSIAGESYEEVRQLAEDGISFALATAAEDRGEAFDEQQIPDMTIHCVARLANAAVGMVAAVQMPGSS